MSGSSLIELSWSDEIELRVGIVGRTDYKIRTSPNPGTAEIDYMSENEPTST